MNNLGKILDDAKKNIVEKNLELYQNLDEEFSDVAGFWNWYLYSRGLIDPDRHEDVQGSDIAMMMALRKIAREAKSHNRNNIIDACGYLAIYDSLQCDNFQSEE